ncbi:zinc finger protein 90-like isoform X2 [Gouania willdenowi]|uniref:zinc finger protein 90-like isoform X2 n=1 Tax=Gouania willdenowi TaxID=441366 RepID=UPI0010544067|nr:zinc finger protein 90-like isoform X2 [Gouania willdenowi]
MCDLVDPPEGEELCVFVLREEEEERMKKDVGCQSFTERKDASVQVDIEHLTPTGVQLLQCLTVGEGPVLLCNRVRSSSRIRRKRQRRGSNGVGEAPSPPPDLSVLQSNSNSQHASVARMKMELDSSVCDVCGKVMKNKSSLARHSFIHTGNKPFSCHLCKFRFNRRDNLQHHLSHVHPEGVAKLEKPRSLQSWLCAVCGKTFNCRSRLKTHEVIHSGVKPYRCDLCPKAYMRTNDLEHHKKVVHADGGALLPSSLLCDFCGKEFKCRSQLSVHFQTHTGERPHLCDVCGRKFARKYQLKRHKLLLHGGHAHPQEDRPHRCSVCPRSFQRAACLRQHLTRAHLELSSVDSTQSVEEKTFPCAVCGKVFKFRSLLASHVLIHSETRPFSCDFCPRSFRRLGHLKRHREVVHANGARSPQSFVCHICGLDKKCSSKLARHTIIHTGERPFTCDLCPARFNRRGNLQQHLRRMHAVGRAAGEAPPILFENDMEVALTYKQEETVQEEPPL